MSHETPFPALPILPLFPLFPVRLLSISICFVRPSLPSSFPFIHLSVCHLHLSVCHLFVYRHRACCLFCCHCHPSSSPSSSPFIIFFVCSHLPAGKMQTWSASLVRKLPARWSQVCILPVAKLIRSCCCF